MSNGSPTAYLLWAMLSSVFFVFLLVHLWLYDRFSCIKWDSGRQPGAFRRVMTYSYLATVPLLVVFSVVMTSIKFKEGYFSTSAFYITPRPVQLWSPEHRRWLFPLNLILSMGWALELVTHLEELAFWLFLLHQGPERRVWFESWEYKTWGLGSMLAVIGLPLTAVVSRHDIGRTQAWVFFVGSTAGTIITLSFLFILFHFPVFIQQVKAGGAAPDVVVRLATFYNLNRIRVIFRFLFTVPLLTIGVDAFFPPYRVVLNPFAIDFLLMIGGLGCFVSSAITLFEAGYTTRIPSPRHSAKATSTLPEYYREHEPQEHDPIPGSKRFSSPTYRLDPHHPTANWTASASCYEMYHDNWMWRGSAEPSMEAEVMKSSPGYESDVERLSSEGILSSPPHSNRRESQAQAFCFGPPERHDSENTAVSQPVSDYTVVQARRSAVLGHLTTLEGEIRGSGSDGPILLQSLSSGQDSDTPSDSKNGRVVFPPRSPRTSQDGPQCVLERRLGRGEIGKQTRRMRENSITIIHPYLMNFTSPIDLLDTLPADAHVSRMV